MDVTDLISVEPWFKGKPVPYACKVNKRLTPEAEKFFMETVREGVSAGKYMHIYSEWNAPTVIAYKPAVAHLDKNETQRLIESNPAAVFRLTHNYRYLNKQVSHPQTRLELASRVIDTLSNPAHNIYMSSDLKNAFWGFPIGPEYRHYFAFTAPDGSQYAPTVMPQGYAPAPFVCASGVSLAFGPIPEPHAEPSLIGDNFRMFQDDGAAGFKTPDDLYDFLSYHFFPRIKWSRFNIHWGKMHLFVTSVHHLGMIFSSGGRIGVDPRRTERLLNWPTPTNAATVRSFVQACQIVRQHIKNFAEIARPLTRLTGTKVVFDWRENVEEVFFRMLKEAVAKAVERHGYDPLLPTILEADASNAAGGCVIKQRVGDGKENVILYDSFTFTLPERRYATFKKELCSVVRFIKKWHCYLGGMRETTVRTDHRPLLGFQDSAGRGAVQGIYARWAEILDSANIKWEFIPGPRNAAADAMSYTIFTDRFMETADPDDNHPPEDEFLLSVRAVGLVLTRDPADVRWESVEDDYKSDEWYKDIVYYLCYGNAPEHYNENAAKKKLARYSRHFVLQDGRLYRRVPQGLVRCATQKDLPDILYQVHDCAGHFALRSTFNRVAPVAWWPSRRDDIQQYVSSCFECTSFGPPLRTERLYPILTL